MSEEQAPLKEKGPPHEQKDNGFEINILWGLLKYKGNYSKQTIIILIIVALLVIIILAFFPVYRLPKWLW